jgi:Gram-negative bacterial TonB protein C-terminal
MKFPVIFASCICLLLAATCGAQNVPTQQSIEAKLHGSPFLMLRGMWDGDELAFDSQGNLVGTAEKMFFSLSAVAVTQIQLTDTQLEIRGSRAGLEFSYKQPSADFAKSLKISASPYGKQEGLDVVIARDVQHPEALDAALDKVFSVGIDEKLVAAAPFYWQSLLAQHLHPGQKASQQASADQTYHPGGGVRNPILKYAPDDLLQREVKLLRVTGVSVIGLVVDENGMPQRVQVVRPLGMGSDEYAVAEVLQYRFTPAIYRGRAVPVEINIEVNFRRY